MKLKAIKTRDEEIEELIVAAVRDNLTEDIKALRVTLAFIKYFDRRKAKKIADCEDFSKLWDNLVLNCRDMRFIDSEDPATDLVIKTLVARGFVEVSK